MRFAAQGRQVRRRQRRRWRRRRAAARGRAGEPRVPRRRGGHRRHALRLPRRGPARDRRARARRWPTSAASSAASSSRRTTTRSATSAREVLSRELPVGSRWASTTSPSSRRPARLRLPRADQAPGEGLVGRTADGQFVVTPLTGCRGRGAARGAPRDRARRRRRHRRPAHRRAVLELRAAVESSSPGLRQRPRAFDMSEHLKKYAAFHEYFVGPRRRPGAGRDAHTAASTPRP